MYCAYLAARYTARVAELALAELKSRHPDHPAAAWNETRSGPLDDTLWTDEQAKQVMACISYTLYARLHLLVNEAPEDIQGSEEGEIHAMVSSYLPTR